MKPILIITLFLCALLSNAQINVNSNQLNGTRYKLFYPTESYRTEEIEWTDSAFFIKQYYMPDIFVHKIASITIKRPYYLSDSIPAAFDHTKVGSSTYGKYLLLFNKKSQTITYYTIAAFDEATISLFYKMPDKDKKVDASDWEKNYIKISQCAPIEVQNDAVKCRLNANDHTAQIFGFGEYELELDDNKIDSPSTFTFEGESYTITSVADSAFAGCTQLVRAKLPNGVTKIGKYAFRGCKNLVSATMQEGIPYIDTGMFRDCEKLTSVSIPESATHIWSLAFSGCKSLASLTLPSGLKKLEGDVFRGCTSLKTITCLATTPPAMREDGTTFNGFDRSQCTLIVTKGCAAKYRAADGWKEFKKIVEK